MECVDLTSYLFVIVDGIGFMEYHSYFLPLSLTFHIIPHICRVRGNDSKGAYLHDSETMIECGEDLYQLVELGVGKASTKTKGRGKQGGFRGNTHRISHVHRP